MLNHEDWVADQQRIAEDLALLDDDLAELAAHAERVDARKLRLDELCPRRSEKERPVFLCQRRGWQIVVLRWPAGPLDGVVVDGFTWVASDGDVERIGTDHYSHEGAVAAAAKWVDAADRS